MFSSVSVCLLAGLREELQILVKFLTADWPRAASPFDFGGDLNTISMF